MAHLVILDGSRIDEKIELSSSETTIGRADDNSIPLHGPSVSGHHCLIRHLKDSYVIIDLVSTNGTSINDRHISKEVLRRGDIIKLGTMPVKIEGNDLPPGENHDNENSGRDTTEPIEDHHAEEGQATRHVDIHPRTRSDQEPVPVMKDFGKKHDSRNVWITVIIILSVVIVGVMVWLISQSLRG